MTFYRYGRNPFDIFSLWFISFFIFYFLTFSSNLGHVLTIVTEWKVQYFRFRVRTEREGGAWCPKDPVTREPTEWLEVNLHTVRVITSVGTQGRFGNGQGQEFTEAFMIDYWRPKLGKWVRYRNITGNEVNMNLTI